MKDKDWKSFLKEANLKGRSQIEAAMRAWCRFGPKELPGDKFRFEKHYEKGGRSVRVDAFKGHQVRFYGTTVKVEGRPMFLVTGTDFSKKKTPMDQDFLNSIGKAALALVELLKDRQTK